MSFGIVVSLWAGFATPASARPDPVCQCDEVRYQPVCGTDGVSYPSTCEAQCAGTEVSYRGACAPVFVPETLRMVSPTACTSYNLTYAYPVENDHRFAGRFANDDVDPFVVEAVDYALVNAPADPTCNGATPHRVELWIQDTLFPDATPSLVWSTTVAHTPVSGVPNAFYTVDVPDFDLEPGQQLYLALSMPNGPAGKLCVMLCNTAIAEPAGEMFWSNAASTPYPWVDASTFFASQPLWNVTGQRVVGGWPEGPGGDM